MIKTIYATPAEVLAAQTLVRRSAITGRPISPIIVKIANARPANSAEQSGEAPPE